MKSVVSLALLVFLASRPVAAQPQVDPGPIHRALAREISRISIEQGQNHSDSAWRRAVALGAETDERYRSRRAGSSGYVTIGGDASLLVVRPDGAPIPAGALRMLKTLAAQHTDYFSEARRNGAVYVLGDGTRFEAAGIFVGDQKVAELERDRR